MDLHLHHIIIIHKKKNLDPHLFQTVYQLYIKKKNLDPHLLQTVYHQKKKKMGGIFFVFGGVWGVPPPKKIA